MCKGDSPATKDRLKQSFRVCVTALLGSLSPRLPWLQHFDVYLGGGTVPVMVFSDLNALTFLHSLKSLSQHLMCWAMFLQTKNLQIRHIRDVDNVMADALSRTP